MTHWKMVYGKSTLLAVTALFFGFLLAGCDDYVQITRDPDVRIPKLATWAWRPAPEPSKARERDSRPVVSRDVISRNETAERDVDANSEAARQKVKTAIEQTLASKGLQQISDPAAADFLVDYHFAVERRNARFAARMAAGVGAGDPRWSDMSTSGFARELLCLISSSESQSTWCIGRSAKSTCTTTRSR